MKNMPPSALQGPMAQQQKVLLYVLPLVFAFSGVNFPIGVLMYWTTTNLWSMGQQFYTIRRMPTPGLGGRAPSQGAPRPGKAAAKGIVREEDARRVDEQPRGQREQPKRQTRHAPGHRVSRLTAARGPASRAPDGWSRRCPVRPGRRPARQPVPRRAGRDEAGAGYEAGDRRQANRPAVLAQGQAGQRPAGGPTGACRTAATGVPPRPDDRSDPATAQRRPHGCTAARRRPGRRRRRSGPSPASRTN